MTTRPASTHAPADISHIHDRHDPAAGTDELAAGYDRDGYVVVPGALDQREVSAARDEATAMCRGLRGHIDGMPTSEQVNPAREPLRDADVLRQYLCIHFPHKTSALMARLGRQPAVVDILTRVVGPDVKMMQSMLFIKSEGKPGQAWHQDEAHIPTRDRSLTAAWIALDDATVENGCLWVIPGSHRSGVLFPTRTQNDQRFDCTDEAFDFGYRDADAIPVEVPAGAAVVFNGYLLHRSLPNTGRHGMRRALVNHYMSATSLLPWNAPAPGAPMALADHRDIVMVAGRDPYARYGTADLVCSHLRPDGDGGCAR